ncbi:MAG TPA: hypothetical protein VLH39_02900 [Magnetospirillaceae bacterium]|nr:hypothetical protein [Magnetospirillaceae bacterium]
MSSDVRIIITAASAAFALSAFTGALSRVTFGALALRAILSGAFFAGLSAGALYLTRRFLPELFVSASGSFLGGAGTRESGSRLNIVLPGGNEINSDGVYSQASLDPDSIGEEDLRSLEREAAEIGADSLVSSVEDEESPRPGPARPPASFEDLDVLPDLDSLTEAFSASPREDIESGNSPERDPISTTGASRDGLDTATMAMAVRTLLKRDRKG